MLLAKGDAMLYLILHCLALLARPPTVPGNAVMGDLIGEPRPALLRSIVEARVISTKTAPWACATPLFEGCLRCVGPPGT